MIKGDFQALRSLTARLRGMGRGGGFARKLFAAVGAAARDQISREFDRGVDPYGRPWAKLKSRRGQPLRDTGRLDNSFHSRPSSTGFSVGTSVGYAAPHQYGATITPRSQLGSFVMRFDRKGRLVSESKAKRLTFVDERTFAHRTFAGGIVIPQRQIIPLRSTGGVGPVWGAAINSAADVELRRWLGRA